ncbi:MAG: hypothetical protein KGR16_07015 [Verrucomicrobia bacterium]|nr:hypothetical protein [Verrucomicrobiota bacterium]MDE3047932.1 hypothetical protein [Verrucomicrobiota bacterium]
MALSETTAKLESLLSALSKDLLKVYRGNKSAAQRVRVGTIRLEKVGKLFRKESVDAEKTGKFRKKKLRKRKR